ncbi:hypothetical protein SAMN05216436_10185 [bacterium A37T11]|nr:hypothetical protein SAMN05216436_10185 [bacterium A37T11]
MLLTLYYRTRQLSLQGSLTYLPGKYRFIISILVGIGLIMVGKAPEKIPGIVLSLNMIPSVIVSASLAWLLITYNHWLIRWLDAVCNWEYQFRKRIIAEIALGIVLPLGTDTYIMWKVYQAAGLDFGTSGFIRFEFWLILVLFMLHHVGYGFWFYKVRTDSFKKPFVESQAVHALATAPITSVIEPQPVLLPAVQDTPPLYELVPCNYKGEKLLVDQWDIGHIYRKGDTGIVYLLKGGYYYTELTIAQLKSLLNDKLFIGIGRNYMISQEIYQEIFKVKKTRNEKTGVDYKRVNYDWFLRIGNKHIKVAPISIQGGHIREIMVWRENRPTKPNGKKKT